MKMDLAPSNFDDVESGQNNPLTSYAEFRERSNGIYDDSSPKTDTLAIVSHSEINLQKLDEHPCHNILLGRGRLWAINRLGLT